jgi:hypothetical protein
MKKYTLIPLLAAGFVLAGCQTTPNVDNGVTAADITINFQEADRFTDASENIGGGSSDYVLDALRDYLKEEAPRHLAIGQKLAVTFTDIDLAGDIPPSARAATQDVRVVRAIHIPRQTFNFSVTDASGAVVKEGSRTLSNMNFQADAINPRSRSEPFFYDKQLLNQWLRDEFKRS